MGGIGLLVLGSRGGGLACPAGVETARRKGSNGFPGNVVKGWF